MTHEIQPPSREQHGKLHLLVGRDLLVSSHAGTRLPIAVYTSPGAPPVMVCLPPSMDDSQMLKAW